LSAVRFLLGGTIFSATGGYIKLPKRIAFKRGTMLSDFINWCASSKLPLPTTSENTHRSGIRPQYPDGYVRSQYPDAYFAPTSATAYLDLKNAKKNKDRKDAGNPGAI
jgi:hypothetical protein